MILSLLTGSAGISQPAVARGGRDKRDERDKVAAESIHVAPFSHVSRGMQHGLLIPHLEHQIEAIAHKEDVRHPAGDQRG